MVNVDLYSAIITKVSNALDTLVSGEKPGFQTLSEGLVVLLSTINILVISNRNGFRLLFGEIAAVYFIRKKIFFYLSTGNCQPSEPALSQLYRHTFVPHSSRSRSNATSRSHRPRTRGRQHVLPAGFISFHKAAAAAHLPGRRGITFSTCAFVYACVRKGLREDTG